MLRTDSKVEYGRFTYTQKSDGLKFTIRIVWANALLALVYHRTDSEGEKWIDLCGFYADLPHLKRCAKSWGGNPLPYERETISNIRLNMYYRESQILLKELVKGGFVVKCYYKEPKREK